MGEIETEEGGEVAVADAGNFFGVGGFVGSSFLLVSETRDKQAASCNS